MFPFRDRREAGRLLARKLAKYANRPDVLALALPRGGVPVAFEVAKALNAPLDVFVVRKLGVPGHEELAMGAIASGGVRVTNYDVVDSLRIPPAVIKAVDRREREELLRRERLYRDDRPQPEIRDRIAILIDDGLATGSTMRAAVAAVRKLRPEKVIVAVPVAAEDARDGLKAEVDEIVCLETPDPFHSVGTWYEAFPQISDDQVRRILTRRPSLRAR